ncbi:tetratricopeptide repeat protein [Formicincola oecophyllae]|uniref:Tetratricopeptide repeat protein n=1 Tax=Formicincola oecophyllae TaxID=2558361 RepID=A0A4Y6U7Y0_9PROT|nr:tetratricopeptide repeat protein [Formicincola oecophyllae]QDH13100.1 tetratricopeptide repeat protein [Formicincola oecophyllae]
MTKRQNIYHSEHLRAWSIFHGENALSAPEEDIKPVFVVFNHMWQHPLTDDMFLQELGWGQEFFEKSNIDAVFINSRHNTWFQEPDFPQLLSVLQGTLSSRKRIYTYGYSMGGYGALRYAAALNACAIAISPHHPDHNVLACLPTPRRAYVFYDPQWEEDQGFIRKLGRAHTFVKVKLPYVCHSTASFLAEMKLLGASIKEFARNQFDAAAFEKLAFQKRRQSPSYFQGLAEANLLKKRENWELLMREKARAMSPVWWSDIHQLKLLLLRMNENVGKGEQTQRLAAARELSELITSLQDQRLEAGKLLVFAQKGSLAISLLRQVTHEEPNNPVAHAFLARALSHADQFKPACKAACRAIILSSRQKHARRWAYRLLLGKIALKKLSNLPKVP